MNPSETDIFITNSIQSIVNDSLFIVSNEETFFQYLLEKLVDIF